MSAGNCAECGRDVKNLLSHQRNVHPRMFFLRPDDPQPHPKAVKVTLYDEYPGYTWDEWRTGQYGIREHGWFIPVDVPDGYRLYGDAR